MLRLPPSTICSVARRAGASDLHLVPGAPPTVRVHGDLIPLADDEKLVPDDTRDLLYRILSTEQQKQLEVNRQLDFSYGVPGLARFRVNVHFQRGSLAAAFRHIPEELADARGARAAAVPARARDAAARPVLVTGPTGSGKSTTLASMVDEINRRSRATSSRSRTRSSSCTGTSAASSRSARSAPTPRPSPRRCARRCARTRT